MPSPISDGTGQPSLTLHRYGVGVDCHSRFFQVCVLIPNGTEIVKIERNVPALWPAMRAAKAWVLQTLMEHGLVKISGRAEIPGRPLLYETTQFFLDHFGLRNLDELPNVEELRKRYLPVSPRSQPPVATEQTAPTSPT